MKKQIFIFAILLTCLVSCSDYVELTPERAMEVLTENFSETCEKVLVTATTDRNKKYKWIKGKADHLVSLDLIEINSKFYKGFGGGGHTKFYYKPTQKLQEEFGNGGKNYTVAESQVIEILGISQDEDAKTATVRFSYSLQPNVLYDFRGYINARRENCNMEVQEAEVAFILYDTGWQLKK